MMHAGPDVSGSAVATPSAAPNPPLLAPLVVDLDGTLTMTDTLVESALVLLKRQPLYVFALPAWAATGRASLKQRLADLVRLDVSTLPWRADLIDYLEAERRKGRRIVLATAANADIAQAVAAHLGLFDDVIASDGRHNLKGAAKLEAIRQRVGPRFVYAGDSAADLAVWQGAEAAVLVGAAPAVARAVTVPVEHTLANPARGVGAWLKAMRVHQWVKNLLILVPLFTGVAFGDLGKGLLALGAFLSFSLAASATYLGNDLWDLESDRIHPRKRQRAFASGRLPLLQGVAVAAGLMCAALALAFAVGRDFAAMLAAYVVLTTAYSWTLKRYVVLDVITLAMLYTWRVLAGSVAVAIPVTPWLLAFSVFTFFSLALVKRCAELVGLQQAGQTSAHGRDYQVRDLVVLWPLGVGASLCSVVVFGLYIGTPLAESHYAHTQLLWLVGVGLLYWIARLWVKTARGEMNDDPIVFALRDRGSRLAVTTMVAVTFVAQWLN